MSKVDSCGITVTVHLGRARPLHASARTTEFVQTIQPDLPCPASPAKIFLFSSNPNHRHISGRPASSWGAFRDRHERGRRDAVDADGALTNALEADGEAVWSWCPDAGIKFAKSFSRVTVARKPGHRGERGISC